MVQRLLPPGPRKLPFFDLLDFRKDPLNFLASVSDKYGDISSFYLANQLVILLNHPDYFKDVFIVNNRNFIKGRALEMAKIFLGEGLLTSEGDFHSRQRRMIQPAFSQKKINAYGRIMADYAKKHTDKWQSGNVYDISSEMMSLTLSIAAKTLFDTDVNSDKAEFQEAMHIVVDLFRDISNPLKIISYKFPVFQSKTTKKSFKFLNDVVFQMIEQRRKSELSGREDLLSALIRSVDDEGDKSGMTDEQIRSEAMTLFLAGHETTANALSWTFYLLAQHPEVLDKLGSELKSVLNGRIPEPEDLHKLVYTRKVFTESMRIYPPAWIVARRNIEEYKLGEYVFPPKTVFFLSQYLSHRDSRFFPEPLIFRPERWTDEFKSSLPKFAYFPFGGGPRTCIGEQFAWMEGILLIATILQSWNFELIAEQNIELYPVITLRPKNGIMMRFKKQI